MPPGDEGGHFRITLKTAKDGVTQWDLFFINSGVQWNLPHSLAWFQAESQWLAEARARTVPAVAFFHTPTKNYQAAIDEGRAIGIANEPVLFSGDEDGLAAGMLKAPGNLRACFCGHSHRNDCHFVEDGVTFAFGRATGHGGYGGEDVPKGGKLIELNPDGTGLKFETLVP
jgi:hypothetical protein